MPVCEIHYQKNLFTNIEIEKITSRLTDVLLKAEGFEINQISRSLCLINLMPSDSMVIGGKLSEYGKIVIKIYVFAEAYSDSIKKGLFIEVTKVFTEENVYCKSQDGNNVWCLILPVEKNNFGAGGKIATLEETKKFVSLLANG
jgi:hypothetical protein